jgi:hypothetical protein
MRTEEIENALRGLSAPKPPENLKARCLATIPATAHLASPLTWKQRLKMPLVRTTLAMAAALAIALLVAGSQPGSVSGAAVFAASVEAMQKVPFYHTRGREVGVDPEGDSKEGDGWYTGRWVESEIWFDEERGLFHESKGKTFMHQMRLSLPDGRHFERVLHDWKVEDKLMITQFDPGQWEKTKSGIARQFTNLRQMAHGINAEVEPQWTSTRSGYWKERRATVLTFLTPPTAAKAARGCPTVRAVLYVDPATKLCMAAKTFARSQRGGEALVGESEFDFSRRPDPSLFDPHRVEQGAGSIKRQQGGPVVSLSP